MENKEWLKSLSDAELDEEIYYMGFWAKYGRHKKHYAKELKECLAERERRKDAHK